MADKFLPPDEQRIFDDIVHRLRTNGWSKIDAEDEALDCLVRRRDRLATPKES